MDSLKAFLSGGFGGVCLVAVGHPFDIVKTRTQLATTAGTNPLTVFKTILAESGPRGLFRGMSAPLAGVPFIFALCFFAFGEGKRLMRSLTGAATDRELSLGAIGVAGALSAVPTTLIMAPGERIKVLLARDAAFKGPVEVARHLVRTEGAGSLFRGATATLLRDGSGSVAYFSVYEGMKRVFEARADADAAAAGTPGAPRTLSTPAILLGGSAAGIANWLVALPMDTLKTRIQGAAAAAGGARAPGIVAVARALVAAEGVGGLYRGLGPALLRAVPANAACFCGMEYSKQALDQLF